MNIRAVVWKVSVLLIAVLMAACGGEQTDNRELPTIITVMVATPSEMPTAESQDVSGRSTLPPSWTPSPTPSETATIPVTPSSTITATPSWTMTATPSETVEASALDDLIELARQFTPLPTEFQVRPVTTPTATIAGFGQVQIATFTPTPLGGVLPTFTPAPTQCTDPAPGGFGTAISNDPSILTSLGCPLGSPPVVASLTGASQYFERGAMLWLSQSPAIIYVLYNDGTYQAFTDTYDASVDPESGGETPPTGLYEPVRGFGKVWRERTAIRDRLGWAITPETGGAANLLEFVRGRMVSTVSRGDILVLAYQGGNDSGTWRAVPGQY